MELTNKGFNTKAVHGGQAPCPQTGAHATPIYQTSTFIFDNVDQGANRFRGEEQGYIYSRLGNPTVKSLEEKIAILENGEAGLAFGSGMAAISAVVMNIVSCGDHIVSEEAIYGCSHTFLSELITKYGVEVSFVDTSDVEAVTKAIKSNTKLLYLETPTNPTLKLCNLNSLANIGKRHQLTTVMDNTFMSPYFQRPLEFGIDVVVHSATKYIGGHGDVVGGIVVGEGDFIHDVSMTTQKDIGGIMGPMDAWLLLRGLKTLGLRMEKHQENAVKVAEFLEDNPQVRQVWYPGLTTHPQYELAKTQLDGYGGMISFELTGGYEAGKDLMNNVELCYLGVSLGDVDTLIQHPASMTHSVVPEEDRLKADITDGLVRLSVGVENIEDIIYDLERSLS